jgi:hypothetical protein
MELQKAPKKEVESEDRQVALSGQLYLGLYFAWLQSDRLYWAMWETPPDRSCGPLYPHSWIHI